VIVCIDLSPLVVVCFGLTRGITCVMPVDTEARLLGLFDNKAELLPLWQRLRPAVERLGPDVRVRPRMVYAEFDRGGEEFVIAEPTSHRRLVVGLTTRACPSRRASGPRTSSAPDESPTASRCTGPASSTRSWPRASARRTTWR